MLKKISIVDLRVGMHLHALEGAWIDHPFWRSKFVVRDPADVAKLQGSAVAEVWIDPALGLDVAEPADAQPALRAPVAAGGDTGAAAARKDSLPAAAAPAMPTPTRSINDELHEAAAICNRGRTAVLAMFNEARMGRSVSTAGAMPLVAEISESVQRNPSALVSLARLKNKDDYSFMHSVAVCALMVVTARQIGMNEEECREAGLAGLMHDLGKAVMPLDVLNKPGKLTDAEFEIIRTHPERGHWLLKEGEGASDKVLDVVLNHHEKMDGTGYPRRMPAEKISTLARLGAICDVYDAITSNRPYKRGWDPAESIARMAGFKGHFDPVLFGVFVKSLGIYPTGCVVRLESGRLAVVIEQNAQALVSPIVKVFHSVRSDMPIPAKLVDLAEASCNDRIVGREAGADQRFPQLVELWAEPAALRRTQR